MSLVANLQQTLHNIVSTDKNAWPAIDDSVLHTVILDELDHGFVLCSGLQPERGD